MKNSSSYRQAAWNVLGEGMWGKTAVTTLILLLIVFYAGHLRICSTFTEMTCI